MGKVCLVIGLVALCLSRAAFAAPAAMDRPTIGLVLAGGGARGIAHVGVIQALEELRIPVDAVAGTSMGALVGGLYASGMSGPELSQVVRTLEWSLAFEDRVSRAQLPPRRKSDDFDYASDVAITVKDGEVRLPLGVVQGQQVRQMIKALMLPVADVDDFDRLPIPYRAVATDIETGEAYVFDGGDVVTAMRASMSLPALLAPVEHDGRLLVDGGLANNIPVDVARAMGVDRVIVVDIGTPLRSREEIHSVLSVADQMVGFLTRRNSELQLDTLTRHDLLVQPDLEGIGMLDFARDSEIERRGYDAAIALAERLQPLSLPEEDWRQHLIARGRPELSDPVIDFIQIANNAGVADAAIRVRISQPLGEPLDRRRLQGDIAEVYALDYWEIIDYHLVQEGRRTGLLLSAQAKGWGENKLKLGLNLISDLDGGSDINAGASYLLKGVNRQGGEIYGRAQLGDTMLFSGEYYQPLDLRSYFFFTSYLGYSDEQILSLGPEFEESEFLSAWRVRDLRGELSFGANLYTSSQFRLGAFRGIGEYRTEFATDDSLQDDSFDTGGLFASYRWDNLDNAYFPTRGGLLYTDYEVHRESFGADSDMERWQLFGQAAFSFGAEQRNSLLFTGKLGQTWGAQATPQNFFQLGGLFNLSGLRQNAFSGRQLGFVMAQYQRRLSEQKVIPLDIPLYAGFSLESGALWQERSDMRLGDMIGSGSVYLALDSPVGPLYLAYGQNAEEQSAIYVSMGWPFLVGSNRLRR